MIPIYIEMIDYGESVETSINFTYEKESNNILPFLDILIIKSQNSFNFQCLQQNHKQIRLNAFLLSPQQNQNRLLSKST